MYVSKIKNWEKIDTDVWEHREGDRVWIEKTPFEWVVKGRDNVGSQTEYTLPQKGWSFSTYEEARRYIIDWMRYHPFL